MSQQIQTVQQILAEHLLRHHELPSLQELCSKSSQTADECSQSLQNLSTEDLLIVFSVLTPNVLLSIFQQTSTSVPSQKLWCELFLHKHNKQHSIGEPITVQFQDNSEEMKSKTAMQELMELKNS